MDFIERIFPLGIKFIKRVWLATTPLLSAVLFPSVQFLPSLLRPRGIPAAPPPSDSLDPTMDVINRGSTAVVKRYRSNIVIKCPDRPTEPDSIDYSEIEKQILDILGPHPRIINFIGSSKEPVGLLFTEANCGDLQRYLDGYNELISDNLRLKWRLQAAEAIAYLHSKEVIHSDLRPENCLLHIYDDNDGPELLLSDFGGSYCKTSDRVIDGNHLPDTGFFNPIKAWISTEDTDIFALGSVFYTIMTGHWPYKSPGPFVSVEEQEQYDEKVNELFMTRKFPPVEDLVGGDIIHECWTENIKDAGAIVSRHEILIRKREQSRRGRVELAYRWLQEQGRILPIFSGGRRCE